MTWFNDSPLRRYARCPVHGYLVVQRWTIRDWQWIHGCQGCMDEAAAFTPRGPFDMVEAE